MGRLAVATYYEVIGATGSKVAKKINVPKDMICNRITGYFSGVGTDLAININVKPGADTILKDEIPLRMWLGANNDLPNLGGEFVLEKNIQPEVIYSASVTGTLYLAFWGVEK